MQESKNGELEQKVVGAEFSGESAGFTNLVLQELTARKAGASPEEQAKIDRFMEENKETLVDFFASFDAVRGSLSDSKSFLEAVANHDAEGLVRAAKELEQEKAASRDAVWLATIVRDMVKFSEFSAVWRFLGKNFVK